MLYIASAIDAGGTSGGSVHVSEVAFGLQALGHKVLVLMRPSAHGITPRALPCGVPLRTLAWPKQMALLGLPRIARITRAFRPDVIIERYYNFAGAGVLVAHKRNLPAMLEVNAPMSDPPGSLKSRLDSLLFGAMRRWAVRQARWSAAIVTPLNTTVPPEIDRATIHELPWGANIERFDPQIRTGDAEKLKALRAELGLEPGLPVAVFLGSFRGWHGVRHFAEAARLLIASGSSLAFLAIGGGPELQPLRELVASWSLPPGRFLFAGPQPHERVPDLLALGDIGVAPFDLSAHAPLTTFGFFWSPLKIFEYMAMALPVVTIDVPPLNEIVRDGQEGLLYSPGDVAGLVDRLLRLSADSDLRARLGAEARRRVAAHYSWQAHCAALDRLMKQISNAR